MKPLDETTTEDRPQDRAPARRAREDWAVRTATEADARIGKRLHTARLAARMTQSALAAELGMSFQQIQKYEKGSSRIAATTLLKIARALGVPLSYFFEDICPEGPGQAQDGLTYLRQFADTAEGVRLLRAYLAIPDQASRKRMLELLEDLSTNDGK